MTGRDVIDALRRRGEWGSYLTFDSYRFLRQLRNEREVCIAFLAWGVEDAREDDTPEALVGKLHHALAGSRKSLLSHSGMPWLMV